LYPNTGSVIDIGGEDSKFILFERDKDHGNLKIKDFSMNTLCAAGTGSFLDQQASRLGFTIEEFAETALKARNAPRIAGRCTVFAKIGHDSPAADSNSRLRAGRRTLLCPGAQLQGSIAKGKDLEKPVAFIGGVGGKRGNAQSHTRCLSLEEIELLGTRAIHIDGRPGSDLCSTR